MRRSRRPTRFSVSSARVAPESLTTPEILECFGRWVELVGAHHACSPTRLNARGARAGLRRHHLAVPITIVWPRSAPDGSRQACTIPRDLDDAAQASNASSDGIAADLHGWDTASTVTRPRAPTLRWPWPTTWWRARMPPKTEALLESVSSWSSIRCMNPDGRERIIGHGGTVERLHAEPRLDAVDAPRPLALCGRGNHYLFDMNRDWMAGTQPETRGRWRIGHCRSTRSSSWTHTRWAASTHSSSIRRRTARTIRVNLHERLDAWQRRLRREDIAAAFDRQRMALLHARVGRWLGAVLLRRLGLPGRRDRASFTNRHATFGKAAAPAPPETHFDLPRSGASPGGRESGEPRDALGESQSRARCVSPERKLNVSSETEGNGRMFVALRAQTALGWTS